MPLGSNEEIAGANPAWSTMIKHTAFPWDLIPTTVEVTNDHIIITYRQLLGTSQQEMIPAESVHGIEVTMDWFFGSLVILHGTPEKKIVISKFHQRDAKDLELEIQKLIESK